MIDWGGKVAAWLAGVTAASGTLAGLIKQPLHGLPRAGFTILIAIAVLSFLGLVFTGPRAAWIALRDRNCKAASSPADLPEAAGDPAASLPGSVVTDRWRPAVSDVSSGMLQLRDNDLRHPGYAARSITGSPPPSVRAGLSIACTQPDAVASTSDLRAKFLGFLGQAAVMDLVRDLTEIGPAAAWTAWDDNPPFNFSAVLAVPGREVAPAAWARILLPGSLTRRYGRDGRCAYMILHVEPRSAGGAPAAPAGLLRWHQRLDAVLGLPGAVAAFLTADLGLATGPDPAAEAGIWLRAPHQLTELVEAGALASVPGTEQSSWFTGFAVASPEGERTADAAVTWLRQICDSALHLDDYEAALARPRRQPGPPGPAVPGGSRQVNSGGAGAQPALASTQADPAASPARRTHPSRLAVAVIGGALVMVAVVLGLAAWLPRSPAAPGAPAGLTLQITPDHGGLGTVFTVSGKGCRPGDQVDIDLGDAAPGGEVSRDRVLYLSPTCQADRRYHMSYNTDGNGRLTWLEISGTIRHDLTLHPGSAYRVQARDGGDLASPWVTYRVR